MDMCGHSELKLRLLFAFLPPPLYISSPADTNLTKCLQFKAGMVGAVCFYHCMEIVSNVVMLTASGEKSYQLSKAVFATWVLSHSDTETTPETH